MSLLDDASLVVVPSGYKAGTVYSVKPTDGSGDLSFTRSNDTATRVNSAGLIEKVRTNLVTYSEEFDDASWSPIGTTVTANNITAPNGTLTADRINAVSGGGTHYIQSNIITFTAGVSYSFSTYAKKGSTPIIQLIGGSTAFGLNNWATYNFDTLEITEGSTATASMIDVGDGWFRLNLTCVCTASSSASAIFIVFTNDKNVRVPSFVASGETVYLWGAQTEVSDFGATDYIPTTTAAVSVGMLANVPRLDYSGGGCPKLLLEPQRTNLVTYSEQFDNASWSKTASSVTANSTTSPSGVVDADTLTANGTSSRHDTFFAPSVTSGTNYTYSVYAKKGTNDFLQLSTGGGFGSNAFANFDLNTGVIGTIGSAATATITALGNGWYRCTMTAPATITGATGIYNLIVTSSTASRLESNTLTTSVFLWGAQLEVGSYATSYIPTLGAAVTRGADVCRTASGVTSIFNSTWTAFGELVIPARGSAGFATGFGLKSVYGSDDVANWVLGVSHSVSTTSAVDFVFYVSGGAVKTVTQAITYGTPFKFAVTSDGVVYVNGVQVSASSSLTPATPVEFGFGRLGQTDFSNSEAERVAQALLFKSILPPADLAALTA